MDIVKLDLLQNSHAFLREAADNAVLARSDPRKWQFAILHICQSVELTVKAMLLKAHPVFIFEDIDKRKNTVSLTTALARLQAKEIGNVSFAESEVKRIRSIANLRNEIIHSEFNLNPLSAEAQFFGVFAFVGYLQARFLGTEIDTIVSGEVLEKMTQIKLALQELSRKARMRIQEEKRDSEWVWCCPQCGEDTFVVEEQIDTCYTCRYQEMSVECPECTNFIFESELVCIADEFDVYEDEDLAIIANDFGYKGKEYVCPNCASKIIEDIEQQKQDAYLEEFGTW